MKKINVLLMPALMLSIFAFTQNPSSPISDSNNQFAFELYQRIASKETGNIFISPFSISTALAMTYAGADKQTAAEMSRTLHFKPNMPDFHQAYGAYILQLENAAAGNVNWLVANRLWGDKKYEMKPEFIDLVKVAYRSPLELVDFQNHPEASRNAINAWVEKQTKERIQNLIPPDAVSSDTRLILTNAVYFKAEWLYQFKKENTKVDLFIKEDASKVKVPFMNFEGAFHYTTTLQYQAIRLPYKGGKHSMIVVLPHKTSPIRVVEGEVESSSFDHLYYEYQPEVKLSLPKFKCTLSLSLSDYLKQMGMPTAFRLMADFSKMTPSNNLSISEVFHKAFIEIDEQGTEAAAATAVVMVLTSSASGGRPKPIEFIANRPFLFYIVDDETKAILFMGRIMNPMQ